MKSINKVAAVLIALGISSAPLLAQDEPAPRGPRGDRGPHGPRAEARGDRDERGPRAERPGQRGPGPEGRAEMIAQRMPLIGALDANKDGVIDSSEIDNAVAALKKLDKNKDGQLTLDEIRPNPPGGPSPREAGAGPRGGGPGPGPRAGRPQPPQK